MIDIGANLTNKSFDSDIEAVLDDAREVGISKILVTGTSVEESERALQLATTHGDVLVSTAGIHPHHADDAPTGWIMQLQQLCSHEQVVAIGECGLDFYRNFSKRESQQSVFESQLELAEEVGLPVFVHDRDSEGLTYQHLLRHRSVPTVVHCFTGSAEDLRRYISIGCYIGITGWICDERRGQELFRLAKDIPSDRLLIETDAPYLLPRTIRPRPKTRRNEPSNLVYVAAAVAKARGSSYEDIARQTEQNARRLFGL